MVKFLLDKGADYHQRCCGNFFCPDDQKDSRTDSLDHEWVDVCEMTNYEGYVVEYMVNILKIGTPKIIIIIVLKLEQLGFTMQLCFQKMQIECQTV